MTWPSEHVGQVQAFRHAPESGLFLFIFLCRNERHGVIWRRSYPTEQCQIPSSPRSIQGRADHFVKVLCQEKLSNPSAP